MTTLYPVSGTYGSILQAYFGQIGAKDKQNLWNSFLKEEGLSANPTDSSKAGDFLVFVQENASTQSTTLSPGEIAKRQIMVNTFKSVLAMLSTLQNTVAVQAKSLLFLSKLQQQYTQMLSQVPVYTPEPTKTWVVSTDPDKFTFGYNNISVSDISTYLANSQVTSGSSTFQLQTNSVTNQTASLVPGRNGGVVLNPGDQVNLQYNFSSSGGFPQVQIVLANQTTSQSAVISVYNGALVTTNSKEAWASAFSSIIMQSLQVVTQVYSNFVGDTHAELPPTYSSNYPNYPYTVTTVYGDLSSNDYIFQASEGDGNNLLTGIVGSWHAIQTSQQVVTRFSADPDDIAITTEPGPSYSAQNMQFGSLYIPWEYSTNDLPEAITYTYGTGTQEHVITGIASIDTQKQQAITNQQQKIGEKNAQLQQFIQTITANKQIAQNQASTQQNSLNSVQQSVSNQNNLLTTIIQTMQGLITSIFK